MEPSSISSTSRQPAPSFSGRGNEPAGYSWLLWASGALLMAGWLAYWGFGARFGVWMASCFPEAIRQAGGSKVPDAAGYVTGRLFDGMWLLSLSIVTLFAAIGFWRFVVLRLNPRSGFAWGAIGLFILANLWCYGAGRSALFWLLLRGTTVQNQAQFRAKELLLKEVKDHPLLALVGSSQARAQFVEEEFNRASSAAGNGKSPWMMELHFPGSLAADVHLVSRRWGRDQVDTFVYYLSPLSFYSANESAVGRDLLRLSDAVEMQAMGTWRQLSTESARYVALGMMVPLFQCRPVLQNALFGFVAVKEVDLPHEVKAEVRREVSTIRITPSADYQKGAFIRFLEQTARKGQEVILIAGQFNPVHEAGMAPEVRADYGLFLKEQAARFPHVTLVWQEELLEQTAEMYLDATHVSEETAERFTAAFSHWFQARFNSP